MKHFREVFKKQDKHNMTKLGIAFLLGIAMLVSSNMFLEDNKKGVETSESFEKIERDVVEASISFEKQLEKRLEEALSMVDGVGNVKVLITLVNGREIVVAQNRVHNESSTREVDSAGGNREIVDIRQEESKIIINGRTGREEPLVLKEIEPKVEGVVIVAEGGGEVSVRDALIRAAQAVLGVEVHKVQVLKMKN